MVLENWSEAMATCQNLITQGKDYPWLYSKLGTIWVKTGQEAKAWPCFQKTAQLRGWHLCQVRDYHFTEDYFTHRLKIWEPYLQTLANQSGIQALEIGSFQGMSACWLLDNILTHSSAKLICLEAKFDPKFRLNIAKSEAGEKVEVLEDNPHKILPSLELDNWDLINLQDRCKQPDYVEKTARLAWKLLKVGGIMIFNDYGWKNRANPQQNPKLGIDNFLNSVSTQVDILKKIPQAYQLIIKKKP